MFKKFIRGLAIAAGTSLAIGIGAAIGSSRRRKPVKQDRFESDDVLLLEPLLNRLDMIESRIAQSPDLQERLNIHSQEILQLAAKLEDSEERAQLAAIRLEQRFAEVRADVPKLIDAGLGPRMEELRLRLQKDLEYSQAQALSAFETQLESRISQRIEAIEGKLTEQSAMLRAITRRSEETDGNLQRLIGAVEKLVERAMQPGSLLPGDAPFQSHMERAGADDALPIPRMFIPSDPRSNFVTDADKEKRRARMSPLV